MSAGFYGLTQHRHHSWWTSAAPQLRPVLDWAGSGCTEDLQLQAFSCRFHSQTHQRHWFIDPGRWLSTQCLMACVWIYGLWPNGQKSPLGHTCSVIFLAQLSVTKTIPSGCHISEGGEAGQRGFIISGDVLLDLWLLLWLFLSEMVNFLCLCGVSMVFWDCKDAQGGWSNLNPSLLRLQSLTHPTTTPSPPTCHPRPFVLPGPVLVYKTTALSGLTS